MVCHAPTHILREQNDTDLNRSIMDIWNYDAATVPFIGQMVQNYSAHSDIIFTHVQNIWLQQQMFRI